MLMETAEGVGLPVTLLDTVIRVLSAAETKANASLVVSVEAVKGHPTQSQHALSLQTDSK